jgi:hypothetical protein
MLALYVSGYPEIQNNHRRTRGVESLNDWVPMYIRRRNKNQDQHPSYARVAFILPRVPLRQRSVPQDIDLIDEGKRRGRIDRKQRREVREKKIKKSGRAGRSP